MKDITLNKRHFADKAEDLIEGFFEKILKRYASSFTFALIVMTVLYNLYLIMKIKYGAKIITKLTLLPYYCSFASLFFFAAKEIVEEYINEDTLFKDDDETVIKLSYQRTWLTFYGFQ